jgi:hypothetical protein
MGQSHPADNIFAALMEQTVDLSRLLLIFYNYTYQRNPVHPGTLLKKQLFNPAQPAPAVIFCQISNRTVKR